jgi:hypothetical protein
MPTLKKVLRDLLNAAAKQPGVLQPAKLQGGLRLAAKIDDGKTYLKVGRDRTYPSDGEWDTVMRSLPYTLAKKYHGRGVGSDTRRWLWATWPTPGQLELGDEGVLRQAQQAQDEEPERPPL